jgi:hypothetical protein
MAPSYAEALTRDQLISLLMIGDNKSNGFSPYVPIDDERLLIRLGYIESQHGRLRVTPPGRVRIASIEANPQVGN